MEIANLEWKIFSQRFDEAVQHQPYWIVDICGQIGLAFTTPNGSWMECHFKYIDTWIWDSTDRQIGSIIAFADFDIDMLPISRPVKISITTEEE